MEKKNLVLSIVICFLFVVTTLLGLPCWAKESPKPIVLTYTLHTPPPPKGGGTNDQAAIEWWTKQIEIQTEGRVKFKIFYGSVLGKVNDYAKMVGGTGVADIGNIIGTYHQWQVPLFAGSMLPFLTTGQDVQARALTRLYNDWAPMREEWTERNLKPLWWYVIDPYFLIKQEEVRQLEDLQGEKIWAAGGHAEIIKRFHVTPVLFPAPQAYEALQKGTINGIIFTYGPISLFKFYETGKVFVDMGFTGAQTPAAEAINLDVWNKISPADQKTIEKISAGMHDWFLEYTKKDHQRLQDFYKSQGVKTISFSSEEEARIRNRCAEEIWADWVSKAEGKGIPGKEFLRRYQAILNELSQ